MIPTSVASPGVSGLLSSSVDPFAWLGTIGDEAGRLIRAKDWSRTPLGPVEHWPQSLRMAASICLQSRFPMLIWWGPEMVMLYNDAYRPILGDKHPRAMGQDGRECWAEIWPVVGPLLAGVRERGEASWSEDQLLMMKRFGFLEETYFTFSYSAIPVEDGGIGGIFTAVTETTSRVIGERRLNTLRQLSIVPKQHNAETACAEAARTLAASPKDLPFALIYLADDNRRTARLVGAAGVDAGDPLAPATLSLDPTDTAPFPVATVLGSGAARTLTGVQSDLAHTVMVLPLVNPGRGETTGVMVAGVSPHRPLDHDCETFLNLVATHVATVVSDARAYEAERRRAEALAEIDRAKTAFFSNVSHEFRTPLTLMLGPLEEAIDADRSSRETLQVAHRNSLRLLKLVNSLLDFSRIEAGRIDAAYEPTDLATFTTELASLFRSAVEKAGLAFVVDCPPLPEPAYVDREMWEKIVFNLLSNALKFTFTGSIAVRLRPAPHARPHTGQNGATASTVTMLTLEVADTGTGIPAEELSRVFDRFHRIRNARSRSHEGTGIGLALVQELTRLHGGRVAVDSTVGAGTVFTISIPAGSAHLPREKVGARHELPRTSTGAMPYVEEALRWLPAEEALDSRAATASVPAADAPRMSKHRGAKILVADDNSDMRDYLRRLLLAAGYEVATVTDGVAALAAAQEGAPALVLSDVMMPRLDGFGLLQALRAAPATKTIPVVLLTARAGEEARIEGVSAGADDYLTKPFSARELLARIETHLDLSRARAAAAAAIESARRRLHDVFMQSPAMICVLRGPEHTFELANGHYLKVVGRTDPAQLIGKPLRVALPELAGQGYPEILDRVYATGESFCGEEMMVRLARSSGGRLEDVYVNFVYQPTRDATNAVDGVLVHAVDVTSQVRSRRRVEELLGRLGEERDRAQASELRLRAIFDTTPECVKLVAADGTLISMNASGLRMIEAPSEASVQGRSIYDVIAPEHHERFRAFNERVCRGEKGALEFDFIGRRGTRRHMETHAAPLPTTQWGTVQLALTRDVTDRVRLADAQRAAEESFRAFVEASSEVVYRMNADWTEMRVLEGKDFIVDTAVPSRDWLNRYIHPEDHVPVLAAIDEAIREKKIFELEHRIIRVNGSLGWIFSRAIPLLDDRGDITEWFGAATDITERRTAEEALRKVTARSEQQRRLYDTVLSNTLDLVYVFGLNHRFTYANQALLTLWGRSWEDAIGRNCLELGYEPWHAEMHDREIDQVIATRQPVRGIVPFTGTQGRRIYDYIFVPVLNAAGEVEAVAGTTRDITELKRKEDTLRFLVELNAAVQPLSDPDEIMAKTAQLLAEHLKVERSTYAEIEHESVFNVIGEHAPGRTSILGRWPVASFGAACAQTLAANEPYVVADADSDPRVRPSDLAAYRAADVRAAICVPLHKCGRFTAAMGVQQSTPREWTKAEIELVQLVAARCWESLERARTLRRLQENEQRLRFVAESMPQKTFTATAEGELDYVNGQWLQFTGGDATRLLGRQWLATVHPDERAGTVRAWEHAVANGEAFTLEHRFRRHDGEYVWHLTRALAYRDRKGHVRLWIGSTTEIEAQKRTEEELERMVAERTAKLRETIGELEAFSYSIAHDLRAPLRALQGFSDVLLTEHAQRLDGEAQGFLRRIAAAGARMDRLIQDVLNYSRIVRGESPLEQVAVEPLVRGIVDTYPQFAPDKARIELIGTFAPALGNEAMLTQVFSNLLGNAVKFVGPGVTPHIRIASEQHDRRVRIAITDNGIGIPADQHRKIFEIFQQADTTYGGTGIGLAIVKKAVERMGGRVGVHSAAGEGSTFWLELPRA